MITMTLKEANKTLEGLNLLGSLHLPAQLAFAIAKNRKNLMNELFIADEQKEKLISEYADKGYIEIEKETGKIIYKNEQEKEKFLKKYNELYNVKTDIDIKKVNYETIQECENETFDTLSVDCINVLLFMLEE
jgi:hypothetical protein|nr:MAG TPA: Protein of unknown function (DUF1617) [Caudoviricetes sp.]